MAYEVPVIKNSAGEVITLTPREKIQSTYWENVIRNSLGYDIQITSLTTIVKKVSEQKFFDIVPSDFMPVIVGNGAFGDQLTTYRSYAIADQFETGIVNTGTNNARMASADAGVDSVNIKIYNWAKSIGWSIFDLEMAAKNNNWDLIAAKEESRKKNFDLGIQRIAFLGARGLNGTNGQCLGLLNQPAVAFNTSLLSGPISGLNYTQLNSFVQTVVEAYRSNCNRTAWPTLLQVPESDYNGMTVFSNPEFPLKTTLEVLEAAFKTSTHNPNFKILPCAYGDKSYSGLATQMYTLLNYDEKSVNLNIPLPYTNTLANTLDGFNFQSAAYAEFTGVQAIRPLEMLYFGF